MKLKAIGITIGAALALVGLLVGAAGVGVLATIGSDGKVSTGDQSFATSGAALVTSAADLRNPGEVADIVGAPRVQLHLQSSKPSFIGVGRAKDVERYLEGAPVDEISDFEVKPFKMKHNPRAGSKQLAPPGSRSFWVAKGSDALDWKAGSDEYRLVVMNADGSRGVQTHGDASVTIPHTAAIAWSLVGGGLMLLLAGLATIATARTSGPGRRQTAPSLGGFPDSADSPAVRP
jgi:hypothetical protein